MEKIRHFAKNYRNCKQNKKQGKGNSIDEDSILAVVSEINAIKGKVSRWWYDSYAIVHVLYDNSLFMTYNESNGEQEIQMSNDGCSKVVEKENVDIIFTSRKIVSLKNVHVFDMNRNLVR